jgi:hypothetical protein
MKKKNITIPTLDEVSNLCGEKLELVVSSNQKEWDYDNFIVRSPHFCAYGSDCPEQAIKNFEYKVVLLSAIEKDIEHIKQSKKNTEDFISNGLGYLIKIYECYNSNTGTFYVDQDREELDPIQFFDEAFDWLNSIAQTVKTAKSMDDMDFLSFIVGEHDLDRGYSCTIWDGYSDKLFPNLISAVANIQENQVLLSCFFDFDTIV